MNKDKTPSRKPSRRLWLRALFGLSLALNLLVVGLGVGTLLRSGGGHPGGDRRPPPVLGATLYRELPHEYRKSFRQTVADAPRERGPGRAEIMQDFTTALRADPFDSSALLALLNEHTARRSDWQATANAVLVGQLEQMSVEERNDYAKRVEIVLSQPVEKKRDKKGGRD